METIVVAVDEITAIIGLVFPYHMSELSPHLLVSLIGFSWTLAPPRIETI
jgi:hypothetical protein